MNNKWVCNECAETDEEKQSKKYPHLCEKCERKIDKEAKMNIKYALNAESNLRHFKQNVVIWKLNGCRRYSYPSYKIEKDIEQAILENQEAERDVKERLLA